MSTIICKKHIKCAVFDLDGTLLNTIKTIHYYLNFALESYNLGSVSQAVTMKFVGDGAIKLIERALASVGADKSHFDEVFKTYNDAYNASPYYLTEPYEGILELISKLKEQGITLAVLSNKPDFAVKATVEHFFGDSFSLAIGGRENIPLKPAPDALLNLLSELQFDREEVIYIGDSEVDVLTARHAEIPTSVAVTWGFRSMEQLISAGAKTICNAPSEILKFI